MSYEKTAPTLRSLEMPRLVVELPDGKETHHHLADGEVTVGRDPKNRIAIADNFISKFHAKLIISKTSIVLVDLGSANKTYVNEQPITESPVRYGDAIRFAAVKCRLEAPGKQQSTASALAPAPRPQAPQAPQPPQPPQPAPPVAPPAPAAPPAPLPVAKPRPSAAAKPAARAKPPGSAPPPIEADPMKRLLRVGGLLILVSLALAVLLRVLLVPSESPPETEAQTGSEAAETAAAPTTAAPITTSLAPAAPVASAGGEQSAEYYFDEGLAHLDTGRLREARESFHHALDLDPEHARARTRLSLLEEEIEKKVERHFDNGRQAYQFLRYEEAIAEWEMFLLLAEEGDVRYAEAQQGIQQAQAKLR